MVNDLAKATGDAEGFLKLTVSKKDTKEVVATRYQKIRLTAGKRQVVPQAFVIENAELWDTENPYLYEVKAQLNLTSTGGIHMSLDNRQDLMAQPITRMRLRQGLVFVPSQQMLKMDSF